MKKFARMVFSLIGLALASVLVAIALPPQMFSPWQGFDVSHPRQQPAIALAHVEPDIITTDAVATGSQSAAPPPVVALPSSAAPPAAPSAAASPPTTPSTAPAGADSAGTAPPAAQAVPAATPSPIAQTAAPAQPPTTTTVPQPQATSSPEPQAMRTDAGGYVYEESFPHESGPAPPAALPTDHARKDGKPRIAIIMDDLGLNEKMTAATIALPAPLTLSFLPYARDLAAQVAKGAAARDTILLHMPMQPMGHDDPGPGALTVDLKPAEIKARVTAALAAVPGAIGLNNHMGSRFTTDADGMKAVFDVLAARHLAYIDSRTTSASVGYKEALAAGIPTAARDVFLDDVIETSAIDAQLKRLIELAKKRGSAIAIGHPYPPTVAVLTLWLPRLKAMGIEQVSVSDLLARKPAPEAAPAPPVVPAESAPAQQK